MGKIADCLIINSGEAMKAGFLALALAAIGAPAHAQQSVIDSIDMQAVCDSAHAHLGYFREHLASPAPNETEFMLQVMVPVTGKPGTREYLWVSHLAPFETDGQGILDDDAERLPLKKGDTLKFRRDMVCDWGFRRDGMMIGHYTTRAALTVLSPDQAMILGARLGQNPE
jgi:uncharacterized protein YegJ (DUF2314 family)